jgi:hypothetical protein
VSEPDEPELLVPRELFGGAWADYVDVFGDFAELTIDFARLDPARRREASSSPVSPRPRVGAVHTEAPSELTKRVE